MKLTNLKRRRGFTLVEMLVVVMIIGILAGMISVAAFRGMGKAKSTRISLEIKQLSMALNQYKQQFGEYPPDFAGLDSTDKTVKDEARTRVLRHVARAFPRFVITGADLDAKWIFFQGLVKTNSKYKIGTTDYEVDLDKMNACNALGFWLGGMPDAKGVYCGFSKDPADPFGVPPSTTTSRIGPFFEFDPTRSPNLSLPTEAKTDYGKFYPHGIPPSTGKPYVYFRAETALGHYYEYCLNNNSTPTFKTWSDDTSATPPHIIDCAKPYWDDQTKGWMKPDTFQILCCGIDGKFGKENVYKSALYKGAEVPDGTSTFPVTVDLRKFVIGTDAKITPNGDDFPKGNFDHIDDHTNFSTGSIGDDLP